MYFWCYFLNFLSELEPCIFWLFSKFKSVINTICHLCIFEVIFFSFQKRSRILSHNGSNGKFLKPLMKTNFIKGQHLFGFICGRWFLKCHFSKCYIPYFCFQIQCDWWELTLDVGRTPWVFACVLVYGCEIIICVQQSPSSTKMPAQRKSSQWLFRDSLVKEVDSSSSSNICAVILNWISRVFL